MYILQYGGDAAEAVAAARRAVGLRPSAAAHRYHLSQALGRAGDVEGALESARQALAMSPDFALFQSWVAELEGKAQ